MIFPSWRYFSAFFVLGISLPMWANDIAEPTQPERKIEIAKPISVNAPQIELAQSTSQSESETLLPQTQISQADLEQALHYALNTNNYQSVAVLLKYYRTLPNTDPILIDFADAQLAYAQGQYAQAISLYRQILAQNAALTPVRIQLAKNLAALNYDSEARNQYEAALSEPNLPQDIRQFVQSQIANLDRRNEWQFDFSVNYLRERNVNNASSATHIENTPFQKNASMLPQRANGVAYRVGVERDFNLLKAHYLHFSQQFDGKSYWDNHDFDDISSRTYFGYRYKQVNHRFSVLPFYERQWYGNHRYKKSHGLRSQWTWQITPKWQFSTALEYARQRYVKSKALDGNSQLASFTLLWRVNPTRFFYTGLDFSRENTATRQYSYDLKSVRFGWGEEWGKGISSRLNLSASLREYKANLALAGGAFQFDKARQDKIYQASLTLWKRDWHIWGITPKLHLRWKQQKSNFPTLYSYLDRSANVLFEKSF